MPAVAINPPDLEALRGLQKTLGLPSKSQVIHRALEALSASVERERLAREITRSVKKCASADLAENAALTGGHVLHAGDEG